VSIFEELISNHVDVATEALEEAIDDTIDTLTGQDDDESED